jgi:hypothetical protein
VLPTGRNISHKTQKWPIKKSQWPEKSAAEFSTQLAKSGRKEAELFLKFVLNRKGYIFY